MTIREVLWVIVACVCILVAAYINKADATELYTWVYGGYATTPYEHTDSYINQEGTNWGVVTIGVSYCNRALDQSSVCAVTYYQHMSHYAISDDVGMNSLSTGIEYRHKWW